MAASTTTIPYSSADITPEWLTAVLREGGHIGGATVTAVEKAIVGEGIGFLGELTQLTLTYDRPAAGAPATLISKIPTAFQQARDVGNAFRFYEREGRFYDEVAPHVDLRVPKCYYNAIDPAADRFLLLLEEIRDAEVGDQLLGCTLEQARTVIPAIAKFHAGWWQSPQLDRLATWMPTMCDPLYDYIEPLWRQSWDTFLDLQAEDYPREAMTPIANRSVDLMNQTRAKLDSLPMSIAHTDFRLDNMFFGAPGSATPFAVIDWQLTVRSSPLLDIGYFLSQSLDTELRRAHEMELLRDYHRVLVENGVRNYSFDQCFDDYRFGIQVMLVIPVTAAGTLDTSSPRAIPLMRVMAERATAAILDLKTWETLPG